jgi:hypothetical protein
MRVPGINSTSATAISSALPGGTAEALIMSRARASWTRSLATLALAGVVMPILAACERSPASTPAAWRRRNP